MTPVKKVVIPVAGLGTRGLPFTKEVPKELLPIIDTPTIYYVVEEAIQAGIEQIIFITSRGKTALEDYFDLSPNLENWLRKRGKEDLAEKIHKIGKMADIISIRQKEPLGLGHAVLCARSVIGHERFAVALGDEIFPSWKSEKNHVTPLAQLVKASDQTKSSVVGVMEVAKPDTKNYGIVDLQGKKLGDETAAITRTVEKPNPDAAPSQYAIVGRYVFESEIMDQLREVRPGSGGEIQLTDGMDKLCPKNKLHALKVQATRYDIGNHFFYLKAQMESALSRPELSDKIKTYLKTL